MVKLICCMLLVIGSGITASGQDLKKVLLDMQQAYEQASRLHVVMEVAVYEQEGVATAVYREQVDIKKEQQNYHYQFGDNHMLLNKKYLLMVDKGTKEIVYSKRNAKGEATYTNLFQVDLDSILSFYEKPLLLASNNTTRHYRVVQKTGAVDRIDLYINPQTQLLKKMEYRYRNGQFVSINFAVFTQQPDFDTTTFDERHFVEIEKGVLKGAGGYRNFNVVERIQ